jgi:probable poly-beta-1,6-N-acetyl-D-glucosamine export protein
MFLTHIHRFRGVAILLIVLEHCIDFLNWQQHPLLSNVLNDFIENSTVLFMFVAGFLFQHLSKSFSYKSYLSKKIQYVLIPYLLMASPAIVYALCKQHVNVTLPELQEHSLLFHIGWFYIYPGVLINYALWFIPVITLYYLSAPVFMVVIENPKLYALLILLIPLSLLAHRPTYSFHHNFQLALYFLSAYILGMFFSQYRKTSEQFFDRYLLWVAGSYFLLFLAHTLFSAHHGYYQVDQIFSFTQGYIDWIYLQQLLLATLLLGTLKRLDNISLPLLEYFGSISFTIYFTHIYALFCIKWFLHFTKMEFSAIALLGVFIITLFATSLFAFVSRKIFWQWSRMLVGS